MGAPRKVHKKSVGKCPTYAKFNQSIEPTIVLQEVTNVMKPVEGAY